MLTLDFKLISNESEKINTTVDYFQKNNILNFKINNDLYQYDINEYILIKKDQEKEITINFKKEVIIINIKSNNIKIDYPMDKSTYKISKNHVELTYMLKQDIEITNKIFIDY